MTRVFILQNQENSKKISQIENETFFLLSSEIIFLQFTVNFLINQSQKIFSFIKVAV